LSTTILPAYSTTISVSNFRSFSSCCCGCCYCVFCSLLVVRIISAIDWWRLSVRVISCRRNQLPCRRSISRLFYHCPSPTLTRPIACGRRPLPTLSFQPHDDARAPSATALSPWLVVVRGTPCRQMCALVSPLTASTSKLQEALKVIKSWLFRLCTD